MKLLKIIYKVFLSFVHFFRILLRVTTEYSDFKEVKQSKEEIKSHKED